jgi:protein-tyrosine phosphatase
MSYSPEIILEGAPNARDLGGIRTTEGGTVRPGRVIRSGPICDITERDAEYLRSINLKTVVDFRADQEKTCRMDVRIDGVEYADCPIIDNRTIGITHELPRDSDGLAEYYVSAAANINERGGGAAMMRTMYANFIRSEFAVEHYRLFLNMLLDNTDGCLLYHCTMGKDRVGAGTAFLLTALGVDRDDIVEDYMYTKTRLDDLSVEMLERCRKYTSDESIISTIYQMDTVDESYIGAVFREMEDECGSAEVYLRDRLGITPERAESLKKIYLD